MAHSKLGSRRRFAVLGPFPPPIHGLSVACERLTRILEEHGDILRLNRAPGQMAGKRRLLLQLVRTLACAVRFAFFCMQSRGRTLYVHLSGGKGQLVDGAFIAIARIFACECLIHHHSFKYVTRRNQLSAFVFRIGSKAKHVALCEEMAAGLAGLYGIPRSDFFVVSNAALLQPCAKTFGHQGAITFGFLSNITMEKGIFDFLRLAADLHPLYPEVQLHIAGPVHSSIAKELEGALVELPYLKYFGAVYDGEKDDYLNGLDVLVFPTAYEHEAEPITILEAMQHGVHFFGYRKGCLPCLAAEEWQICDTYEALLARSCVFIERCADVSYRTLMSSRASRHFEVLQDAGVLALSDLLASGIKGK